MRPAFDAMLTIEPPPSSRYGSAAWHTRNVPVRLTPMMRCHSSNGISCECEKRADAGAVEHHRRPAEVGRRGRRPPAAPSPGRRRRPCTRVPVPPCSAISAAVFSTASATMSRHADRGAFGRELQRGRPPEARAGARHERHPSVESPHVVPPSLVGRRNLIRSVHANRRSTANGPPERGRRAVFASRSLGGRES